jgi:hypothetical protein
MPKEKFGKPIPVKWGCDAKNSETPNLDLRIDPETMKRIDEIEKIARRSASVIRFIP